MRMISHSYDSYDHAVRAVNALEAAGVRHDDISLVSGDKDRNVATSVAGDHPENTGAATGATTGTVLGGGAGLLAGLGLLAIPGVGPVVAAGWLVATLTGAGIGAATGGLLGSLTGAGVDEADAKTYADHVGRGGTLVTVRAEDGMAAQVEDILEHGEARSSSNATSAAAAPVRAVAAAGASVAAAAADKIEVVKEDLTVGKHAVEQGGVKVTSHVVETPVQEQVRLREERVSIDRRPINRPLAGVAADAFRDRTLSATAMSEQAVVSKDARVVEEIGLRKDATDRVETVRDTVRETKVNVEQVPGRLGTRSSADVTGKPSPVRDNAATRAVDNTLGTNVSGENPSRKI